jgi:beta-mannanase
VLAIPAALLLVASVTSPSVLGPEPISGELRVAGRTSDQPSADSAARPIGLGVYRPSFPADLSALDEYEHASGNKLAIVHWYALWGGWLSEFRGADLEAVAARGSLPLITWEPWAGRASDPDWTLKASILSGRNDAYIESWARGLAAYRGRVLLRFAHEMHDQTYPWAVGINGNTAADYLASWRHVRDIFRREGATNVEWVWSPNTIGDADRDAHIAVYASLYPGDENVDWVGLDVFNTGPGLDWGAPYWRSFSEVLWHPYAAITAVSSKPLVLPEVGCVETGGSKAAWVREALAEQLAVSFPRVRALVWFDVRKEDDWRLASSPEALRAWTDAAAQSLFRPDANWVEGLRPG